MSGSCRVDTSYFPKYLQHYLFFVEVSQCKQPRMNFKETRTGS